MKKAIVGVVASIGLAVPLVSSPPAEAAVLAHTIATWGGSPCIPVYTVNKYNPYTTGYVTQCTGGFAEWYQTAESGYWVGVDPDMGNADWVSCTLYIGGTLVASDYASRGDGHEATCLMRI